MIDSRYHRQTIFPGIGQEGQQRLAAATIVVVGCGATGSHLAEMLTRTGVGRLRVVDRDFVELTNLQRQTLFDEDDIAANLPKAVAAVDKLRRINHTIEIESVVADVNPGNVLDLLADATVVLDGTDNFSTRYLLNDACVRLGKPWVYTGVIASYGMTATLIPDAAAEELPGERAATACLRCLLGVIPAPGTTATCDTAGVVGPVVSMLTGVAAGEAIKLIVGTGELNSGMLYMDLWHHSYEVFGTPPRRPDCPVCGEGRFDFLDAKVGTTSTSLCGRNAVQVAASGDAQLDLARLATQLNGVAQNLRRNDYLLKAQIDDYEFTIFPDQRAIIKGTEDETLAKSLYARYIGG